MAHVHSNEGRLGWVLALTASYTIAEIVGGLWSNSLALLADAGHMIGDNIAILIALFAARAAHRPPNPNRTFGYRRAEILAALFNGSLLLVIAVVVVIEAFQRFFSPVDVAWRPMAWVGLGGLLVNAIAVWLLHGPHSNLNMRGAYLHVLGDLFGSVGVIIAALATGFGGIRIADPIASTILCIILVYGAGRLILNSIDVLMEGTPSGIDATAVQGALRDLAGVADVHDLHIWSISGQAPLLTAHLVAQPTTKHAELLREATTMLERDFSITHTTIQIEPSDFNILVAPDR